MTRILALAAAATVALALVASTAAAGTYTITTRCTTNHTTGMKVCTRVTSPVRH